MHQFCKPKQIGLYLTWVRTRALRKDKKLPKNHRFVKRVFLKLNTLDRCLQILKSYFVNPLEADDSNEMHILTGPVIFSTLYVCQNNRILYTFSNPKEGYNT